MRRRMVLSIWFRFMAPNRCECQSQKKLHRSAGQKLLFIFLSLAVSPKDLAKLRKPEPLEQAGLLHHQLLAAGVRKQRGVPARGSAGSD